MSELSSFKEFQSFISEDNFGSNEQSQMDLEERLSAEKIKPYSIEQSSLEENVTNVSRKNNESVSGFELSMGKNVEPKYPLTEKAKRENATKARIEHERKCKQIKKINENITRGVEDIKNSTRKVQTNKLQSLVRINNSQWYRHDRTSFYDLQGSSFNEKIESLEQKLKKLEDELILEKKSLTENANGRTITVDGHDNDIASDGNPIDTNIDEDEGVPRQDHSNTLEYLDDLAFMNVGTKNDNVHQTASKLETRLTFIPKQITLEVKRTDSDLVTNDVFKQHITVSNRSKSAVFCRYGRLFDPNSVFQDSVKIIHVQPDAWCRLQPAISVDFTVTFKPTKLPNSVIHPLERRKGLEGTKLVFETTSNDRPDVLYVFHIPIEFCMIKPEPELVTKTITFTVDLNSSKNINPKKYLIVKNNGNADCVFSVLGETDYQRTHNYNGSSADSYSTEITKYDTNNRIIGDVINSVFHNMFQNFMWGNHRDVLLPARKSVKIPVKFNQYLARSSISECYTIAFANNEHNMIPDQKVFVTGHIRNQIIVKPDVIDAGLCYLMSSVQAVRIHLQNNNRVMVPFEIKLPREMSKHVQLSHSKGYLKAESTIEVFVRLNLKYDILKPDSCKTYFNADSGSLDFPVWVYSSNSNIFSAVRIVAVVTTPFGLKLTPDTLDFGTVNTTETVVRSVMLANHSRSTMAYGFLKLPERISVHPSAFGTIFSGESLLLHVHYSPSAKDLPENCHTFVDEFVLTCNTITGLNAKKFNSKLNTTEQLHETTTINTSFSSDNQKSEIISEKEINDLDHGPDKIRIIKMKNTVEVNSLDENAILKEAIIICHAKVHDIPVEISVQKIVFAKTHFTSYSTFKIELRASNLASIIERKIRSFPNFKIRFEFVSHDPCIEFKPKNGILQSKEVIQICVTFRPKLDEKLQKLYDENLDSHVTKNITEKISKDPNSDIHQVYRNETFSNKQINVFEAKTVFYSSMIDTTSIVSAACFIQFIKQTSVEYFGFDTGSLKLNLVCPTTKPNVILFSDRIDFGKRAVHVRHDEWLLVRNVTPCPVRLRVSPTNPIGPFFCAHATNGEQSLLPGHTVPIKVSFTPERETPVSEVLEITSGTMRLTVRLSGSGFRPSCDIMPGNIFNVIQTTHGGPNKEFIFRVTNTSETSVRFNVQLEWTKWHPEPMTDEEAYELAETFRADYSTVPMMLQLDGPDWTEVQEGDDEVFDLGNGGRPLWFHLKSGGMRYVEVTFKPPGGDSTPRQDRSDDADEEIGSGSEENGHESNDGGSVGTPRTAGGSSDSHGTAATTVFRRRVYAAKLNVHVGRSVLRLMYVIGFVVRSADAALSDSLDVTGV